MRTTRVCHCGLAIESVLAHIEDEVPTWFDDDIVEEEEAEGQV